MNIGFESRSVLFLKQRNLNVITFRAAKRLGAVSDLYSVHGSENFDGFKHMWSTEMAVINSLIGKHLFQNR